MSLWSAVCDMSNGSRMFLMLSCAVLPVAFCALCVSSVRLWNSIGVGGDLRRMSGGCPRACACVVCARQLFKEFVAGHKSRHACTLLGDVEGQHGGMLTARLAVCYA